MLLTEVVTSAPSLTQALLAALTALAGAIVTVSSLPAAHARVRKCRHLNHAFFVPYATEAGMTAYKGPAMVLNARS